MAKPGWGARLRYRFDNLMAKGAPAMIGGLGLLFLVLVLGFALVVHLTEVPPDPATPGEALGLWDAFWASLMRTLDSGTMGDDKGTFGFIMLGVTLVGIFVLSTLIGILSSGIESTLDRLRKGRSRIIESGHSVILGWSDQIYTIVSELITANESRGKSCIAVMGELDKVEMEDRLADYTGRSGRTRIICRSGNPILTGDLAIMNLDEARSIIVLSGEGEDPDAQVIKTVLAITNNPQRKQGAYHIVAELREPRNLDVARMVGKDELEIVLVGDLISRITAQTCRQSGLSIVYTELLDVQGDEIYFTEQPALVGKTYGEALLAFEEATVFGLHRAGDVPRVNAPMDAVLGPGDRLIVIAADRNRLRLAKKTLPPAVDAISGGSASAALPERTLVLGWNWRAPRVIGELDNYVAPGSSVLLVSSCEEAAGEVAALRDGLVNLQLDCRTADTTDRTVLDGLAVTDFDHIVLLCYSDRLDAQQADARTLITLLHLRDISEKTGRPLSIVSEMLDIRNRDLAQVARVNDFIVSDNLISLLLTQISENKHLAAVFADMFDPEGSEIYLKPAGRYVRPGIAVSFATVIEAARRLGESAIGYKLAALAADPEAAFGVIVNPPRSTMLSFAEGDRVIVAAED